MSRIGTISGEAKGAGMKKYLAVILAALLLLLGACGSDSAASNEDAGAENMAESGENEDNYTLFPMTDGAYVGDTMPYFEDGKMNIYYLADQRDGKTGYHPWALFRTEDYCTYEDAGIVIPYAESASEQDNALGTGCVMKDQNGGYHAFYTGHNDYYDPAEAVMHATGTDLTHWTKVPEDTFTGTDPYSTDDFRDPYVFYVPEEQKYWMLVVTRSAGTGVIVKYTSTDLHKWTDEGVFFADDMGYGTNMECPSLLQFKGKWYLAFSDQWPDRVVHIRVSDSINGPFVRPEQHTFDGNGFYAGRLETDGERLYIVGWNGTKIKHDDMNDYDWAGSMVVHELEQKPDGSLAPVVNEKVVEKLSREMPVKPAALTETAEFSDGNVRFSGNEYEIAQFDPFPGTVRVEADITGFKGEDMFGISFAPDIENAGSLTYLFNVKENKVEFYNAPDLFNEDAQSFMDFDFSGKDSIHMTLLLSGGVASLYVDDEIALTARMYRSQGTSWEFFGIRSGVSFENIGFYH